MFTPINKFFVENVNPTRTVFYRGENGISFAEFARDVARMANIFAKTQNDTIVLFIPDNIYLFYVCFIDA